jgi:hypothetical protein
MTPSGVKWFSSLLQRLATAIRERFQHVHDRLRLVPELKGRDLEDLYLNP